MLFVKGNLSGNHVAHPDGVLAYVAGRKADGFGRLFEAELLFAGKPICLPALGLDAEPNPHLSQFQELEIEFLIQPVLQVEFRDGRLMVENQAAKEPEP